MANFFNRVFNDDKAGGRIRSRTEPRSIVLIASKHGLDPLSLTNAMVDAYKSGPQHLGDLEITYRRDNKASHMFLLTKEGKVVSQFPLTSDLMLNPNLLRRLVSDVPVPDRLLLEFRRQPKNIEELRFGMRKVNINARIVELPPKRLVTTEFGQFYVCNATIADDTGKIKLSLWNAQIEKVHAGDQVGIENGRVYSYAGEQQLRIGRKGTISIIEMNQQPLAQ